MLSTDEGTHFEDERKKHLGKDNFLWMKPIVLTFGELIFVHVIRNYIFSRNAKFKWWLSQELLQELLRELSQQPLKD